MKKYNLKKVAIFATIICVSIIVIEGILFLYLKNKNEKNISYYDAYQMVKADGSDIVAVGSSDFKNSKNNKYTEGLEKGKLVKFDKKGNIIFEVQYDKGLSSTFTSVLVTKDGYVVTGSGEYSEYQQENDLRDAFLIKYDKKGKKVWEKYYGVLANTRFNKAIEVEDGYVVIGQSLYEKMEVGNHTTGGGIIVKYDFDGNEVWHNNHGGNKSGNFNGIVEVNDDFYVVGKDGTESGNLVKFNSNGKYEWHKNYDHTDSIGFNDIAYKNKKLYIIGSKKITADEDKKVKNTDGVIAVYDMKGNLKNETTFGGSKLERFTGIEIVDDKLFVVGISNSLDSDLNIKLNKDIDGISSGFILSYNDDLKLNKSKVLGGMNNDVITDVSVSDNKLYISGYSNSMDGTISKKENNGKDYFGKIITSDSNLKLNIIK